MESSHCMKGPLWELAESGFKPLRNYKDISVTCPVGDVSVALDPL